jgi:hypothetical protein
MLLCALINRLSSGHSRIDNETHNLGRFVLPHIACRPRWFTDFKHGEESRINSRGREGRESKKTIPSNLFAVDDALGVGGAECRCRRTALLIGLPVTTPLFVRRGKVYGLPPTKLRMTDHNGQKDLQPVRLSKHLPDPRLPPHATPAD